MSDNIHPQEVEMKGWLSSSNKSSDDLNNKAKGVFKLTSNSKFNEEFFRRYEDTNRSDIRVGRRISGPNSDVDASVERITNEDQELVDFIKGDANSVGLPILMQEIHFDRNFWKKNEVEEWLINKGLNPEIQESDELFNHWKSVQIPEVNFQPSQWRLYSFKDEIKVVAGKFQ